ncbi:MAG TPA: alpha-N-arabinofuranosidase, partial [Terriglobales bacterium]
INSVLRDSAVTTAGYQGTPTPNQWFGGPEFTANSPLFGRTITLREGSMVLRDAAGLVVDSLNYGGLVDPWAAEGYQATSGAEQSGCFVFAPGPAGGFGPPAAPAVAINQSVGRFPDGADTDSNCTDFVTQAASSLSAATDPGATNIKVASVQGFDVGQKITIDAGANRETAVIAKVGTAGATTVGSSTDVGVTVIPVASAIGFRDGQTITIDSGANSETAVIASIRRFGATAITVTTPLTHQHAAGSQVAGTGIDLTAALTRAHTSGTQVYDNVPTPGAANHYVRRGH